MGKGIWPGGTILIQDLKEITSPINNLPLHALEEGMGADIILTSMFTENNLSFAQIDSAILSATTLWSRCTMHV